MATVYLGRQPIINLKSKLYAYEVLYRDEHKESNITDNRFASASVLNNILNKFGAKSLLGDHPAFVKIDQKFLMHDIIFTIPNNLFVFTILESVEINERVIERVQQLHAKGYTIAINDISLTQDKLNHYRPILKELSYIKININREIDPEIERIVNTIKDNEIQIIGTKIEDNSYYELAKGLGCDFFQGYFFAKPNIVENKKIEPSQLNILKLYNLLMTDTNIDEITQEFENNHALTIQLLQFINSGAFHFRSRIASIHHVLMLIGRVPLGQWLMLMIYSKSVDKSGKCSPLMLMVKNRTELMENLLRALQPDVKSNALGEAYFVGVLSLLETIFNVKIEEIMKNMHISEDVENAILNQTGLLGDLLVLVQDIEVFNTIAIEDFSNKHNISVKEIRKIILMSMEKVNHFEEALQAS